MNERTIACVVRNVAEGGVAYRGFDRVIMSVDVEVEAEKSGDGAFRATLSLPPDEQPRIGDRVTIHIAPVT